MNFHQPLENWVWGGNRMDLAVKLATGKSVLHVGCVDEGIVSRETLHQKLGKVASKIHGVDVIDKKEDGYTFFNFERNVAKFKTTEYIDNGPKEPSIGTIEKVLFPEIDIVICTEVLEHLDGVCPLLRNLRSVGAEEYFFSVPNGFSWEHRSLLGQDIELIHPDHRCWFSPYTLENVLKKAGYEPKEKFMLGWGAQPALVFTAEGVGMLAV